MGWDGMGGMGWDGMGWDGMGWDGMGWDVLFCFVLFCFVLFCFVLFCFVKNALARVVLVPSRRLPIFSSVVRFLYPCITRAPPPFFFPSPKNLSRLLELVLPKKTKQPAAGLYRQVPFLVFLMYFW